MKNFINIIVSENDKKLRIDSFIHNKEKSLSRTRIKNLILKNKLKLNNKIITDPSKIVRLGDKVILEIPEPEETSLKPYNYKLDIVFEDNDLIVLNKKSGISMHPGPGNYENTIVNALMNYVGGKLSNIGDKLRPGIIHRIDKDTSGLIVVAKNNKAHINLAKQFKEHTISRRYKAIVWGSPDNQSIEGYIERNRKNRKKMSLNNKGFGKFSKTDIKLEKTFGIFLKSLA